MIHDRLQTTFRNGFGCFGGRQKFEDYTRRVLIGCACGNACGEYRDFLHFRRQRRDVIDTRHRQQLAHLLKANLSFSARDDGADSFAAFDAPALG